MIKDTRIVTVMTGSTSLVLMLLIAAVALVAAFVTIGRRDT